MHVHSTPAEITLQDDSSRPKGLHVSQIIGDLMKTLYPDVYGQPLNGVKITAGVEFERLLEKALQATVTPGLFRPPPIQKDGIWLSPDGIDPGPLRVEEFKLTWYSMRDWDPDCKRAWPWKVQIMAYCYALQMHQARLIVYFVNGDYRPPKPVLVCYYLTFTDLELYENWQMLVNHAKAKGWL